MALRRQRDLGGRELCAGGRQDGWVGIYDP